MPLGNIAFGQDDVVSLDSSYGDFRFVEIDLLPFTTLFSDDYSEHISSSRDSILPR